MMKKTIAGLLMASAAVFAQGLEFEVASIKPVGPIVPGSNQQVSAGIHIDGNQFRANFLSLKEIMAIGYGMRLYQIESPDWTAAERFDISAKMPVLEAGRTMKEDEFSPMVRKLIEERFQIKTHRLSKDFPIYALVQLKDGIKAKEDELDAIDPNNKDGVTVGGTGGAQGTAISLGRGATMTVGGNRIEAKKVSMLVLAEVLARFMDKPVQDQTGVTKTYDVTIDLTPEDFQALMIRAAVASGVTLPPQALAIMEKASGDSLHEALAKLGLKLEPKKVPMDMLIVDSLNRQPSEN
jgi:uncharacterized protein (TIGR03435 family)